MKKYPFLLHPVALMVGVSAIILFAFSSLRHWLFYSSALDLGWFDQAVYLISQGETPIVSFSGVHILGDHAAFIFYPLALLYTIYPDVHWLFAVQAIALALGAFPTWQLAKQAGLTEAQAVAMAGVYLLYPLIFNINLFDFHSEVIALPAILWAVFAARSGNLRGFLLAVALTLSCKAVLSLTVVAMAFWLLLFEKKRLYGSIALFLGTFWFILTTQWIIPHFSGAEVAAVGRYTFLGDSVTEIIQNLIFKPNIILSHLFTADNLEYLALLLAPIVWGLSPRHLAPMVGAIPQLGLNLLTDYQPQKDLIHQYSLPLLPFLLLSVIATLAAGKGWFRHPKGIIIWALIAFLALAKYGYFTAKYLEQIDTLPAMRQATLLVPEQRALLVSPQISPHLTHRNHVKLIIKANEPFAIAEYDSILLNARYPGWESSQETVVNLLNQLQQDANFKLHYQKDDVWLFEKVLK